MSIKRLSDLKDYRVAEGEPDIRGWEVYDRAGERLGTVEDLLIDTEGCRVHEALVRVPSHRLTLPVAHVTLDADRHAVHVPATRAELQGPAARAPEPEAVEIHRLAPIQVEPVATGALEPEETAPPGQDPGLRDAPYPEDTGR